MVTRQIEASPPPASSEFRLLFRLSAPVVIAQLGMMMMGVVDTIMVARVGVAELAAIALATTFAWTWGSLGQGLLHGMDPIVSQAHGAGDGEGAALALQRGLVLAVLVSIPIAILWTLTGSLLELSGQDPKVSLLVHSYMLARLPAALASNVFVALRQYLAGRTVTRPAMWVTLATNGLNVLLNWVLIFGHLGFPPLGLVGAGLATGITSVLMVVGLVLWIRVFDLHRGAWRRWDRRSFDLGGLGRYVRLGAPIALQMWLTSSAFSMGMLMVGWLGVVELAAYQVVFNVATVTYMVPLGIAIGAATRVGNLIGGGRSRWLEQACRTALAMGGGTMVLAAVGLVVLRNWLPTVYVSDPVVIALAAALFPIGALFQIADGLQVVGGGLMRGMGRPRAGAIASLIGYYVFGLPLAALLTFHFNLATAGVLYGFSAGIGIVAAILGTWSMRTSRKPIDQLLVARH